LGTYRWEFNRLVIRAATCRASIPALGLATARGFRLRPRRVRCPSEQHNG
jgi:hypothetical protein